MSSDTCVNWSHHMHKDKHENTFLEVFLIVVELLLTSHIAHGTRSKKFQLHNLSLCLIIEYCIMQP